MMKKNMLTWHTTFKLLAIVLFLFNFCPSCQSNKSTSISSEINKDTAQPHPDTVNKTNALLAIEKAKSLLADGELITRSDNDFESLTLQNFLKRDRSFSHCGIGFKEDSTFWVYHIITGTENPGGLVRSDPFDSFVNPSMKTGFGIFKYRINDKETDRFHAILKKNYEDKIPFDVTFNFKSEDSLYCSEMIYKALKKATNNKLTIPTSALTNFKPKIFGFKYNNTFFKHFEYVGIDDLYMNQFCTELIRVKY
jgi:hypothetical protein